MQVADDIDLLGGREEEHQQVTERLEKTAAGYGMKIRSDKSKILGNSIKTTRRSTNNIRMNRKMLEEVDQFKYF